MNPEELRQRRLKGHISFARFIEQGGSVEVKLCTVCERQRAVPPGYLFCEDCWQKARQRMKAEEEA